MEHKYVLSEVKPCADVLGYSVKGKIYDTTFKVLYDTLADIDNKAKFIKSANMVICKIESCEFYLYDDNSFIISEIVSEEAACILIEKILNYNIILGAV